MRKNLFHRDVNRSDLAMSDAVIPSNRPTLSRKLGRLLGVACIGFGSLMVLSAHAAAPLSDDELDTKYLDVPVKSPYISKVDFDKANAHQSAETTSGIATLNGSTALLIASTQETPLLAGIDQNTRLLGNAEQLGVSAGIASTAIPLAFGSENFSYKWSGNLDQVFTPTVEASRLMQYVFNTNGAEVYYVPLYRTGSTESFVHSDTIVRN